MVSGEIPDCSPHATAVVVFLVAQGTSKSKGKGKAKESRGHSASDADTISDEDTGQSYPRNQTNGVKTSPSPDPIDLIDQPSSDVQKVHDFDRPNTAPNQRPNSTRLPPDGSSTLRLKGKIRKEPETITIVDDDDDDGVSDDIQSASGFDVPDPEFGARGPVVALKSEERRAATPSGRTKIRAGLVQNNIKMFETSTSASQPKDPPSKGKAHEPVAVRTINFNNVKSNTQSKKSQMKGKGQKVSSVLYQRNIAL